MEATVWLIVRHYVGRANDFNYLARKQREKFIRRVYLALNRLGDRVAASSQDLDNETT
jgi:hypothetical protein